MFTREQLKLKEIDKDYFVILHKSSTTIELQSKNTKHIWAIQSKKTFWDKPPTIVILHKHSDLYPYHEQKNCKCKTLKEVQDYIKDHDQYHLRIRTKGKKYLS